MEQLFHLREEKQKVYCQLLYMNITVKIQLSLYDLTFDSQREAFTSIWKWFKKKNPGGKT
jgi:hypothetical protein